MQSKENYIINMIIRGVKLRVKRLVNEVTNLTEQTVRFRQGCSLSSYQFNLFTYDITGFVNRDQAHPL
jgi:hypothetical protein